MRADSSLSWLGETLGSETVEPVHCNSIFIKAYFMHFPCRKNSQKDTCQNVNICQFWMIGLGVVFTFFFSAFSDFHIIILINSVKQKYSFLWASRCKCFCWLVLANMPDACSVTQIIQQQVWYQCLGAISRSQQTGFDDLLSTKFFTGNSNSRGLINDFTWRGSRS